MKKSAIITSLVLGLALTAGSASYALAQISPEQAKEIVLKHAGVSPAEAGFIKVKQDFDDGITEYEIEFWKGSTEYDYTVNAANGQIISHKQEVNQNYVNTAPAVPQTQGQGLISNDRASQIALQHAGLSSNQVRRLTSYQEYDDGRPVCKVKFWKDYTEYDYEIDAATGNIIEFDIEQN